MTRADKAVVLLLRTLGVGSLLALVPVFMPFSWMAATHRWLGLGEVPAGPVAHNLGNFLWQLVLPKSVNHWTLTTLREKLIKIGAKAVSHPKYLVFQLAEVAVPRNLFAAIPTRIGQLRLACASG
jgi:hypothetical protein